MSCKSNN